MSLKISSFRSMIILTVLLITAFGFCVYLGLEVTLLRMRVSFAREQVSVLQDTKQSAQRITDPNELVDLLRYAVNYYPSGTKQPTNTALDQIVENVRTDTIAAILDRLRSVTGHEEPHGQTGWFERYPPRPN